MGAVSDQSLQGTLHIYPFAGSDRSTIAAEQYATLSEEYATERILCLTRLCNEEDLTEKLSESIDTIRSPTVMSLRSFATETLQSLSPDLSVLSDHERIELLAALLSQYEWETEYLATAAQQESFQQDIGELLIEMESRDRLDAETYDSSVLQEIAAVGREFQSFLADRDYVDQPSLIPQAAEAIRTASPPDEIPDAVTQWDALLVADFEEFAPVERRLLAALSSAANARICALGERQSRILSSWREAGTLESMADGLSIEQAETPTNASSAPQIIGEYLAAGRCSSTESADGTVQVIEAPTFRDQLTAVADEIERLCRQDEYSYSDITIAYQDSSAPIEQTLQLLRRHGIPTTTVAVSQLGTDPAVRELFDVTTVCADTPADDSQIESQDRLLRRDVIDSDVLETISTAPDAATGLWQWVHETHLKDRIGSDWSDIEARDQFRRVQEVLELAEFLTAEDQLDGTWDGFHTALQRGFKYSSTRLENIETERDAGGVPVGTIYGLKHTASKAVFLLNVTDQEYPFTPDLTSLLPRTRLRSELNFPLLTTQSHADVTDTFGDDAESSDDPFRAYFAQVSRRLLGIGARTATERLYLGIPRESGDALGTYQQPSRFLPPLIDAFDWVEPHSDSKETTVASYGSASDVVVEHVDDTLEAIRRAGVGGDPVDLDRYERELAAIETLVDQPEATTIRDALEARIEFRHGRVRRD